jgi:hypothetical protein
MPAYSTGVGMTVALAIAGGIVVVLAAATKIPPAVGALIRAFIPVVTAVHDLRQAISNCGSRDDDVHDADKKVGMSGSGVAR